METNLKEIERTAKLKQDENKERIWEDSRLNDEITKPEKDLFRF